MHFRKLITTMIKAACVSLAAFTPINAAADGAEFMEIGYGKNRSVAYMQVENRGTGGSAIHLTDNAAAMYAGCKITEIAVDLGEPTGKDSVRVFITRALDGQPLYEQRYTAQERGWNTVVLDTPFELDGSAVYIGYEVTGQYYLLYRNAYADCEEWIRQGTEGWKQYTDIYTASFYATVTGANLPRNNIRLGNVSMPDYAVKGEPLHVSGQFVNLGLDAVGSLTFTCYADGQPAGEQTVSVDSVAYKESGTFDFSGFGFASSGARHVAITVSAVNGQPDRDPSDNGTQERKVTVIDKFVKRNTLMEVFSTERCSTCPGQHEIIASTFSGVPGIIEVGHHAGFYYDKFTIDESTAYECFYGDGRTYAPAIMFDRTEFSDNLPQYYTGGSPLTAFNSSLLLSAYAEATAVPAFASIEVSPKFDYGERKLSLTVSGRQLLPTEEGKKTMLNVYVTEDSIYSDTQAGAAEGFHHRYVIRRSLTGTWGEEVDVEGGFSATFTAEIPEEWNIGMLRAVAFVAYDDPTDVCGRNVLNSVEARIAGGTPSGIGAEGVDGGVQAPAFDGTNLVTPGGFDTMSVFDATGTCRMRSTAGGTFTSLESLPKGLYIVRINTGGNRHTMKIIID